EKRIELTLAAFPSCTVEEFKIKFRAMCNEEPGKSALQKMLQRLSTLKLIGIDGDVTDSDTQLVLYPGIPLALDRNSIEESVAMLVKTEDSDVDA
ncbi:MAG: hypothetical protein LBM77_13210, partial [Spirochaetaceae bacterium]|nr:hypothetical protein [Spirochaetaceae bacterium]